ncbi:MAG: ribonuclease J [Erysipelotrichaceae bacterium]|nr:ribonuclease J [Erysipelotrichaceae bacterium]
MMGFSGKDGVLIYAIGGLGEVGKNMYCIESAKDILIIDCGVKFPTDDLLGIDYVISDYSYLKQNSHKIRALLITHGHEDHIGAIPFLVQAIPSLPIVYAPKLAAALMISKLANFRVKQPITIKEYHADSVLHLGDFKVSFIRVTHSIPDSYGIVVDTSEGRIITTGDFKVDLTPVGPDFEITKMATLGSEGVDLLLSDSTNAEIEGYTPSERNVASSIEDVFSNTKGRLIISTFSSNVSRIQQIITACIRFNRKVLILGSSMEKVVDIARKYGYINISDLNVIKVDDMKLYKQEQICILCTGSQGEAMAVLSRIARNDFKNVTIHAGDTVVFSSSPIPGNGNSINKIINLLARQGANVITNSVLNNVHSSGHPSKQELRLVLTLLKPAYFMPVHGEYRMLSQHRDIAESLSIPKDHIFVVENGRVLFLKDHKVSLKDERIPCEDVYIDGKSIMGISKQIIQERQILNDNGVVILAVLLQNKGQELVRLHLHKRGFVQDESIFNKATNLLISKYFKNNYNAIAPQDLKTILVKELDVFFFRNTKRHPMIIPFILEL